MSRSGSWVLVFATAFASVVACTKKEEAGAPSPVPPLAQGPTAPAAAPAPTPPPPPPPPPAAPEAAAPAARPGGLITGKIDLPAALAKTKPQGTVFLVARRLSDNPTARGTLI